MTSPGLLDSCNRNHCGGDRRLATFVLNRRVNLQSTRGTALTNMPAGAGPDIHEVRASRSLEVISRRGREERGTPATPPEER